MSVEALTKKEQMMAVRDDVLNLKTSPLFAYRTENNYFPVIGAGNHDADILFVGEAPGKNEALTGQPFCGASGKLLDKLLDSINMPREEVYIANILKDRPQNNRDPLPEEIEVYAPFLDRQIEIIEPKVIATLGRFSMEYIMKKYGLEDKLQTIGKLHGQTFPVKTESGEFKIIPLYHPAAAIYTRALEGELLKDFQILKKCA